MTTTAPAEIYFWVGHPATEESTSCGIRVITALPALFAELTTTYGEIDGDLDVEGLEAATTFSTTRGYRVAMLPREMVDVEINQERISEWVAGAW